MEVDAQGMASHTIGIATPEMPGAQPAHLCQLLVRRFQLLLHARQRCLLERKSRGRAKARHAQGGNARHPLFNAGCKRTPAQCNQLLCLLHTSPPQPQHSMLPTCISAPSAVMPRLSDRSRSSSASSWECTASAASSACGRVGRAAVVPR